MPSFILISFETVRFLFKDDAKTLSPNMYTLGYSNLEHRKDRKYFITNRTAKGIISPSIYLKNLSHRKHSAKQIHNPTIFTLKSDYYDYFPVFDT